MLARESALLGVGMLGVGLLLLEHFLTFLVENQNQRKKVAMESQGFKDLRDRIIIIFKIQRYNVRNSSKGINAYIK